MGPHAAVAAPPPTLTLRLVLLWTFVLIGRPQDVLTFLQPLRPALLLAVATVLAMLIEGHWRKLSTAMATPESKRYLLFFVIMILGIPFAYHRGMAFEGVFEQYLPNILFFLFLVAEIDSVQKLKSLVWVVCLSTFWFGFVSGLLLGGNFKGDAGRFQMAGQMFDANDTAYVLTSLFPLCLFFLYYRESVLKWSLAIIALGSAIAVILLTGSRGGFLGLGSVLLILLLTRIGGMKARHKVVFTLGMIGLFLAFQDKLDIERYLSIADLSSDYNVTEEGGRMQIWAGALEMIAGRPLLGVGYECAPWGLYMLREAAGASYLGWQHTHNAYLQVASEIGLIGFALFVTLIGASMRSFIRAGRVGVGERGSGELRTLGGLMLLGFVGQLVTAFFLSQGYSVYFSFYFALGVVVRRLSSEVVGGETVARAHTTRPRSMREAYD